jgi:type 1 glutamine amidotransferase
VGIERFYLEDLMKRILMLALVMCVGCFCGSARAAEGGKKKIVFIAGTPSHEWGGHEHKAGCELLAKCLNDSMGDKVEAKVYSMTDGWPKPDAFNGADAVVIYCDGGNGHPFIKHMEEIDNLAKKGVGIGMIHYAVEPGDGKQQPDGRAEFLKWIGGYFETFYSVNPVWKANVTSLPTHPVTSGVRPFTTTDEWYYHMRFRPQLKGVTQIICAIPPDSTRNKKDDAHGGNPEVRKGIGQNTPECMVWVSENTDPAYNGQRGFGCTGGHVYWNWAQDDFRKTILNAIVWIAKADVPPNGVDSKRPTVAEMIPNMDKKRRPADKTDASLEAYITQINKPMKASAK